MLKFILFFLIFYINYIKCQNSNVLNNTSSVLNSTTIYYKSCYQCDCKLIDYCELCNNPIPKKDNFKTTLFYVSGNQQQNFTYFITDKSIKWESIDIIALYGKKYDKRISCIAHQKNVKVIFNLEESSLCSFKHDPTCIWNQTIIQQQSLPKILNLLQDNNIDGINLDFEKCDIYSNSVKYSILLESIYKFLKNLNPNYIISTTISTRYGSSFKIKDILNYSDYITIMAYDFNTNIKFTNFTEYPNSPISIRRDIKNYFIDQLTLNDLKKVILIIPFYGYLTKCSKNINLIKENNNNLFNSLELFSNECIIGDLRPFQITFKEIDNLIYNRYTNLNQLNNFNEQVNFQLSSGVLYDSIHQTVYANLIDENNDRWQIIFDTPFSIYKKINSLGIGGIGCWTIEKISGMSQPLIDSFYFSLNKNNIGNSFK